MADMRYIFLVGPFIVFVWKWNTELNFLLNHSNMWIWFWIFDSHFFCSSKKLFFFQNDKSLDLLGVFNDGKILQFSCDFRAVFALKFFFFSGTKKPRFAWIFQRNSLDFLGFLRQNFFCPSIWFLNNKKHWFNCFRWCFSKFFFFGFFCWKRRRIRRFT